MCLLNSVDFLPISSSISENICQFVCSEVANDCRARSFGQKSLLNQALAAASVVICCVFGCLLVMCSEWEVLPSCRAASFYLRLAISAPQNRLIHGSSLSSSNSVQPLVKRSEFALIFLFIILGDNSISWDVSGVVWSCKVRFWNSIVIRLISCLITQSHTPLIIIIYHSRQ